MNPFKLRNRLKALRNLAIRGNTTQFLELSIKTKRELPKGSEIYNLLTSAENSYNQGDRIDYINKAIKEIK